jgi:uncharacterized linocin/CFP29 family protein
MFVANGLHGNQAARLLGSNCDPGVLRPFRDDRYPGYNFLTLNAGTPDEKTITTNANALLTRDEWLIVDTKVRELARKRLTAVNQLRSRGLGVTLSNAMAKTAIYREMVGDIGRANVSMEGTVKGNNDRVELKGQFTPLPIIHKDFDLSLRQIQEARTSANSFESTMLQQATRKVAEEAEMMLLGTGTAYNFGGNYVYGYCNYPDRQLQDLTDPTDEAWTPDLFIAEIIAMKKKAIEKQHYGPYVLNLGPDWETVLDKDYSTQYPGVTILDRVKRIAKIEAVEIMDYMSGYDAVLATMTSDNVEELIGMDVTPVQWETDGGMSIHFKVMTIMVPRFGSDFDGKCGIVHGSVPE